MRILALVSVLALAATSFPAAAEEAEARATFQALELKVTSAVRDNDVETLDSLLAPNFAWAIAFEGRPHEVMNRSEWLQSGKFMRLKSFDISHLVAETFDDLTLVNFRLTASGNLGESTQVGGPYVVTDLWSKDGKSWKLLRRFLSYPAPLPAKR
jgi:hypothetical protein